MAQRARPRGGLTLTIGADRVEKGRLLMAGLGEEIRGLWDTLSRIDAAPAPNGHLDLSGDSVFDVLNWFAAPSRRSARSTSRSSTTPTRSVISTLGQLTGGAWRSAGLRPPGTMQSITRRSSTPASIAPSARSRTGATSSFLCGSSAPVASTRCSPRRTAVSLRHTRRRTTAKSRGARSLLDPLLDAFDFFDSLAPSLARRDADGQLAHFPLPPPPIAESHL